MKDITYLENVSLKNYNTYKLDVKAKYLIEVKSIEALREVLKYLKEQRIKYYILGNGSNVILDDYYNGAIIKLNGLKEIKIDKRVVKCDAGVMMGSLATKTVDHSLTGLEWAINIPGTVGGSIVNNAGAYNSEIFDNLVEIEVLNQDLELKVLKKEDIKYEYRSTNLKNKGLIVVRATFKLEEGCKEESLTLMKDRCERRKETQPLDMPSAGSVFRNPENDYAGRLIEEAGLKGFKIGGAMVSKKHANFIVNTGSATSNDIKNLIRLIQEKVKLKFNVDLILEQEIVDWKN